MTSRYRTVLRPVFHWAHSFYFEPTVFMFDMFQAPGDEEISRVDSVCFHVGVDSLLHLKTVHFSGSYRPHPAISEESASSEDCHPAELSKLPVQHVGVSSLPVNTDADDIIPEKERCYHRWSSMPQAGELVWIRYAGNVSYGRLVHCMPELNMFTVRPEDGGLTRLVTRGLEDILPVRSEQSIMSPPADDEWETTTVCEHSLTRTSEYCESISAYPRSAESLAPFHSPLFIDACEGFSPRRMSTDEGTPMGPSTSFTGIHSTSPASFTLSPTLGHSESGDCGSQPRFDDLPSQTQQMISSSLFTTSESGALRQPSESSRSYWRIPSSTGVIDDSTVGADKSPAVRRFSQTEQPLIDEDSEQLSSSADQSYSLQLPHDTPTLTTSSTIVASAIEVLRQCIDTFAASNQRLSPTKATQEAALSALNEAVRLLLIITDYGSQVRYPTYTQSMSSSPASPPPPSLDTMNVSSLSTSSPCDAYHISNPSPMCKRCGVNPASRPFFFSGPFADAQGEPGCDILSDLPHGELRFYPATTSSTQLTPEHEPSNNQRRSSAPLASATGFTTHTMPTGRGHSETTLSRYFKDWITERYPTDITHPTQSLDTRADSPLDPQVPIALRALKRVCLSADDPMCLDLTDLLRKLTSVLLALAEEPVHSDATMPVTTSVGEPVVRRYTSVGTQSGLGDGRETPQLLSKIGVARATEKYADDEHEGAARTQISSARSSGAPSNPLTHSASEINKSGFNPPVDHISKTLPTMVHTAGSVTQSEIQRSTVPTLSVFGGQSYSSDALPSHSFVSRVDPSTASRSMQPTLSHTRIHPNHRKQRTMSETAHSTSGLSFVSTAGTVLGRSDVKKCRKVYGIEHRDQWCNQCRWKKACRRFPDASPIAVTSSPSSFTSTPPLGPTVSTHTHLVPSEATHTTEGSTDTSTSLQSVEDKAPTVIEPVPVSCETDVSLGSPFQP
ncbi:hypothetical protein X801_10639 [Opisthorchis viverrini]|uniref:Zinc finger protein n=1 Tax=Opisthorchis viverrini TaxID=6198 RepID=A0A1S8WH18_OPIVI|nr:hypothetical protein X801_10639 [Opisthorchis viverrini]